MKKQIGIALILILVVGLAVVGVGYLRNTQEARKQNEAAQSMKSNDDTTTESETTVAEDEVPEGSYTNYSQAAVESTSGTKLLFFHAPWCPQCRMIESDIESSKIPAGVTIFKVDYDTNQELRQEYDVTLQTTFVRLDDMGELAEKYVAYNEPTFDSVKENLLEE